MLHMIECTSKEELPKMAKPDQIQGWIRVCKDDRLHKKCKMIGCYEPATEAPRKLMMLLDIADSDAIDLLMRDFGGGWVMNVYPVHVLQEFLEEDHSVIAG